LVVVARLFDSIGVLEFGDLLGRLGFWRLDGTNLASPAGCGEGNGANRYDIVPVVPLASPFPGKKLSDTAARRPPEYRRPRPGAFRFLHSVGFPSVPSASEQAWHLSFLNIRIQ
jgi:hypothetical protein